MHNDQDIRVKVKYNEEVLQIPWCTSEAGVEDGCEIAEFLEEFTKRLVWDQSDMD